MQRYVLSNDDFGFIEAVSVRVPGTRVLDVRLGTGRAQRPRDWDWPAVRLERQGDLATLHLLRPENAARFLLEVVTDTDAPADAAPPAGQLHRLAPGTEAEIRARLAQRRIVFLGTARDCAKALPATVQRLRELGSLFAEHAIHVYENDSRDGTGALLDQMAADRLLTAHREQGIAARMPLRTERLAYARNHLLDTIGAGQGWDYVCWADMDGLVGARFGDEGFLSCFLNEAAWDAVFPLSYPLYYDMYALREATVCASDYVIDGQRRFDAMLGPDAAQIHASTQQLQPGRLKGWLPVRSAFGGFGLYKAEVVRLGRYVGVIDGDEVCEHVPYHESLCRAGARLYLNPSCVTHVI